MAKRIAIFNGFSFHYEMFGCVLEFLTKNGLEFSIYSETANEMGWISFYESVFGTLAIQPINAYDSSKYDYVFLLTDDDYKYKVHWRSSKVILFEHYSRRHVLRPAHQRIQIRHFKSRTPASPINTWAFPVWDICKMPKANHDVQIVGIGNTCPKNPDELRPWFKDITLPKFIFINRDPSPTIFEHDLWAPYSNVTLLTNIDARKMLEIAASADWLLIIPKNGNQLYDSISATMPIAYGVGTPLLMAKEWCEIYDFGGMIPLDPSNAIEKPTEAVMKELFETKEALINRRDSLFAESLSR
jgi:hypothetical protein